jgi:two-component system sensor histidine kinase CiaH
MNERMIRKMRLKFLGISTLSFVMVMVFMGGLIYMVNITVVRKEIHAAMKEIAGNEGELPEVLSDPPQENLQRAEKNGRIRRSQNDQESNTIGNIFRMIFGAERGGFLSNDTRYFAVLFDEHKEIQSIKISHIGDIGREDARAIANETLQEHSDFGSKGDFYYLVADRGGGGQIIVYMDAYNEMRISNRILYLAALLLLVGLTISFVLLRWLSFKMIQPEIEAADRQTAFLTNASHELKTPLSVIRANTEIDMMLNGTNEWNQSTMRQVDRLTGLIQNLVMITRAAEQEDKGFLQECDVSKSVIETVNSFIPVAENDGKHLECTTAESVQLLCDESKIRQLVTLLVDNAIKYCDEHGTIRVILSQKGKTVRMDVSNDYAAGKNVDYSKFFHRFYREEKSHNIDKGGYGIGLSIAESIVKRYLGTINASWKDGRICFTCILRGGKLKTS